MASPRAGKLIGGGDWAANRLVPDVLEAFRVGQPVVLYNGDAAWSAATDVAQLILKALGLVAQHLATRQAPIGATQGARLEGVENDTG